MRPCSDLHFQGFRTPARFSLEELVTYAQDEDFTWEATGCDNAESLLAQVTDPTTDSSGQIASGLARYNFTLPTPNYTAGFSMNLAYEVKNAIIVVAVAIGNEVGYGLVTPTSTVVLPPTLVTSELDLSGVQRVGSREGKESFSWGFKPQGASTGTIKLLFLPAHCNSETSGCNSDISWARLADEPAKNKTMSFSLNTWTPTKWPAMNYHRRFDAPDLKCPKAGLNDDDCGHTFGFNSGFSKVVNDADGKYVSGQIRLNPTDCRMITNAADNARAQVCEDWKVIVQSPSVGGVSHTAATLMDVIDPTPNTKPSVLQSLIDADGRLYVPPERTTEADFVLGFNGGLLNGMGGKVRTNSKFFEQLDFPMSFLKDHPGAIEVCINDGEPRNPRTSICHNERDSSGKVIPKPVNCVPRLPGVLDSCEAVPGSKSVPLAPYIRY